MPERTFLAIGFGKAKYWESCLNMGIVVGSWLAKKSIIFELNWQTGSTLCISA
jgi:hypothetical protein